MDGNLEHNHEIAQTIALLSSGRECNRDNISYTDMIINPSFPGHEPVSNDKGNTLLGRIFGIPTPTHNIPQTSIQEWSIRALLNDKMLSTYSIPPNKLHICTEQDALKTILDVVLPFSLPWKLRKQTITNLIIEFGYISGGKNYICS